MFDHVQRQPVAFFTRTQTGSLVSRLNSDVIGAQQAFTSTLSNVVGSAATLIATLLAMLFLSWQITLMALVLLPLFLLPARWLAPKLSQITRERYQLDAAMGQTMTERFNVSGALLVKLFGRPSEESATFAGRAARVRDIGVTTTMYSTVVMVALALVASLATALVYGVGGVFVVNGTLAVGTLVALTAYLNRLYGPITSLSNVQVDVMTTLVSFERVFEVLDLEPAISEAEDAVPLPAGPTSIEFDSVEFRYPSAAEVSLASLESVDADRLSSRAGADVAARPVVPRRARPDGRPRGPVRRRQDHHRQPGVASVRRDRGSGASGGHRRAHRHAPVGPRQRRRRLPGRPPVPRHAAGQPAVRQARRDRVRAGRARCVPRRSGI